MTVDFAQQALYEVLMERARQDRLWGEQNHEPQEWLGILMEEVAEFAKHANDAHWHPERLDLVKLHTEVVQTAAVALVIVECLDRGKWVAALRAHGVEVPAE